MLNQILIKYYKYYEIMNMFCCIKLDKNREDS